jgi:hypothetical protein
MNDNYFYEYISSINKKDKNNFIITDKSKTSITLLHKNLYKRYDNKYNSNYVEFVVHSKNKKIPKIFIDSNSHTYISIIPKNKLDPIQYNEASYECIVYSIPRSKIITEGIFIDLTSILVQKDDFEGSYKEKPNYLKNINSFVSIRVIYNEGSLDVDPDEEIPDSPPEEDDDVVIIGANGFENVNLKINPNTYFELKLVLPEGININSVEGLTESLQYNYNTKTLYGYVLTPKNHLVQFITDEKILEVTINSHNTSRYIV